MISALLVMASAVLPWVHWPVVLLTEAEVLWRVLRSVVPVVPSLAPQPILLAPAATAPTKIAMASVTGLLAGNQSNCKFIAEQAGHSGLFFLCDQANGSNLSSAALGKQDRAALP
jgi:hypothetical protein